MTAVPEPLQTDATPEQMFLSLKDRRGCVWLDSARVEERFGRYSFLTAEPFLVFSSRGDRWRVESWLEENTSSFSNSNVGAASTPRPATHCTPNRRDMVVAPTLNQGVGDPFATLAELLARYTSETRADTPFPLGGAFGYFGYDLKNQVERLPHGAPDDIGLPDCWFGFYDWLLVFDHVAEHVFQLRLGDRSMFDVRSVPLIQSSAVSTGSRPRACRGVPSPSATSSGPSGPRSSIRSNFTRPDYLRAITRAKDYIAAGDIYQVNLSQRFHARTSLSAADLYLSLRETNAAPFAAYLDIGEAQILSSSPERFLRLSGRHVQTRPIKGTRPRTGDDAKDQVAARELMMSAKDQAELVMITDLERNDLGRVCEFGSVHVPELVRLEEYATVFHLVSTVEGRLREGVSHVEAVRACYPGGSITGAPKIRAMEIIDELEPHARGVYTGAIGYFGFNGETDFNIAIRTMVQKQDHIWFHAGGGIVADSDPAAEYDETLAKARGMIEALEQSVQGSGLRVQGSASGPQSSVLSPQS